MQVQYRFSYVSNIHIIILHKIHTNKKYAWETLTLNSELHLTDHVMHFHTSNFLINLPFYQTEEDIMRKDIHMRKIVHDKICKFQE